MLRASFILSLLVGILLPHCLMAQQDTLFWFAPPDIAASQGEQPVGIRLLSYDNPATVELSLPANASFSPITVNLAANGTNFIDLTSFLVDIEPNAANAVDSNGIRITSTSAITAYYELSATGNAEVFSMKGKKAIGMEFYLPAQALWDNGPTTPATSSGFEIVATENNTTVLITPRAAIVGHAKNMTFSVTLMQGETYSARETDLIASTSLSGSIISSDKPVAVTFFEGALTEGSCQSTAGDQLTSTDFLGTDFIVHKGRAINERVYILAVQNGTSVQVTNTGTTSTLINWGETYEIDITELTFIKSNKPVYALHVSGEGCRLGAAQLPPVFCSGTYQTAFSRASTDSLGVILYTRTGFEDDFELNGNASSIPASSFSVVPGTSGEFSAAIVYFNTTDVPVGSHNVITNSGDIFGMGILTGEQNGSAAYAYLSEFSSYPFVNAGRNDTICANVPFNLNGVVGGGSVTGSWGATGFGQFSSMLDELTNEYVPSDLDTIISPINIILTSTGPCPQVKDTLQLWVEPAPIVNASADQVVCANNAVTTLNGAVTGGANSGVWTSLGTGTFSPSANDLGALYTPSLADTTNGTVDLVLTSQGSTGCAVETDTMTLTITTAPIVNAGVDTIYVCANNALANLSGTVSAGSTTGKWTTAGNGQFLPDNFSLNCSYQPTASDVAAGSVRLYLESTSNGDCLATKDSLLLIFTDKPQVEAGLNALLCTNAPQVNLNGMIAGPTTTGKWSGGAGTFSPNDSTLNAVYTPTASEISSGNMILTLTTTENQTCAAESDFITINFVAPPFANFSTTSVCLNDTTTLTDFSLPGFGSITNWKWDFGDGNGSTDKNTTYTFSNSGIQTVDLIVTTTAGCSDTTSKQVQVYDLPVADFTYSGTCNGGTQVVVNFEDNSTTPSDPINYWFYDFGGQGASATEDATQLFTGSGSFLITHIVSTVNGCRDTTIQTLVIPPKPEAGFFYSTNNGLNIGAEFSFFDTSNFSIDHYWTFGDGTDSDLQNPDHVFFNNGTYLVTQYVTGDLGCVDSTSALITINTVTQEIDRLIPNAISPNGDGKNDVWKLRFVRLLYPNAVVDIYNRWGQQVYHSQGYEIPWDGTMDGEPLPDGTYYYVIDLNNSSEPDPYTGAVLVLKKRGDL